MIYKIEDYMIDKACSIKQALVSLNKLSGKALTLFVVDDNMRLLGTLTDGDIRRSLIKGAMLEDNVSTIMNADFAYLEDGRIDFYRIKEYIKRGVELIPELDNNKKLIKIYNLKEYNSLLPLDAVLMAGGKGERLRPLTEKTPKPLLKIGEKPIIDYNIESLTKCGINNINVTVNYLADQLEDHFKDPINDVFVRTVREPSFLGTMGSIKYIEQFYNDTILVMNSDLFTNINYEDFYLSFLESDADMAVAAVPYSVSVPYGIFELDGSIINGIKEKPTYNYYANSGIYLLKKEILDEIPSGVYFDATDLINKLISLEKKVIRFPLAGYWIDIGKPVDYHKAKELVKHL